MLPKICGGFINLTQKCNLKCKYCFVVQQPLEMTYETAKDTADFFAKNGLSELKEPGLTFFGGEPMLKYDDIIKPLTEYIRATYGDFSLSITTNGTLLNEERLKFFKDNNVGILLSIDGDKETQDFNRPYHNGRGSFDDIDLDLYLKYYPNGTFRATLDPRTVGKMYDNFVFAEGKGFRSVTFIPNIFEDWSDEEVKTFKEQAFKIAEHIKETNSNTLFNLLEDGKGFLRELEGLEEGYFRDKGQHLPACGRCGLGGSYFGSVGSSGDVYSCQEMTENPEFDEFKIGNIYTGIDDKKRLELTCSFNTKNVTSSDKEKCKNCELYRICNGGCTINNFFKTGSLDVIPSFYCEFLQTSLEIAKGENK